MDMDGLQTCLDLAGCQASAVKGEAVVCSILTDVCSDRAVGLVERAPLEF